MTVGRMLVAPNDWMVGPHVSRHSLRSCCSGSPEVIGIGGGTPYGCSVTAPRIHAVATADFGLDSFGEAMLVPESGWPALRNILTRCEQGQWAVAGAFP